MSRQETGARVIRSFLLCLAAAVVWSQVSFGYGPVAWMAGGAVLGVIGWSQFRRPPRRHRFGRGPLNQRRTQRQRIPRPILRGGA